VVCHRLNTPSNFFFSRFFPPIPVVLWRFNALEEQLIGKSEPLCLCGICIGLGSSSTPHLRVAGHIFPLPGIYSEAVNPLFQFRVHGWVSLFSDLFPDLLSQDPHFQLICITDQPSFLFSPLLRMLATEIFFCAWRIKSFL